MKEYANMNLVDKAWKEISKKMNSEGKFHFFNYIFCQSIYLFVSLSISLLVWLSVCLFDCLSACLSFSLPTCQLVGL